MTVQVTVESELINDLDDNEASILAHELSMRFAELLDDYDVLARENVEVTL